MIVLFLHEAADSLLDFPRWGIYVGLPLYVYTPRVNIELITAWIVPAGQPEICRGSVESRWKTLRHSYK
jgi:hypothetical protein